MNEQEIKSKLDQLAEFKSQSDVVRLEYKKLLDEAMPADVKKRLDELDAEFADKQMAVTHNIASLEEEIKQSVLEFGASVKGSFLHAVYVKGRVSWDSKTLDKFVNQYPEIGVARNEGNPSVSLRSSK